MSEHFFKARQGKPRQGKPRQGKARQARQDKARQGTARQGKTRQDKVMQGKVRQDTVRKGKRQGLAVIAQSVARGIYEGDGEPKCSEFNSRCRHIS